VIQSRGARARAAFCLAALRQAQGKPFDCAQGGPYGVKQLDDCASWPEQGEIRAEGEAGLVVEEYLQAQRQA